MELFPIWTSSRVVEEGRTWGRQQGIMENGTKGHMPFYSLVDVSKAQAQFRHPRGSTCLFCPSSICCFLFSGELPPEELSPSCKIG